MLGSFAVLTQRGPFSRNLLSYDLESVEERAEVGTWYLVPFMHDVAAALLVSMDPLARQPVDGRMVPFPVLSRCCAPGVYPDIGDSVSALQRALEQQILGWEDALGIVRFLQGSQRHDRREARLTAPEPAVLLHNLQTVAGRDASFATRTSPIRQLLSDNCTESGLSSSLWRIPTPARRLLYQQGVVTDRRLADIPDLRPIHADAEGHLQLYIEAFSERAEHIRPIIEGIIAAGGSVAFIVSSDVLAALYEKMFLDQWQLPVIRWPAAPGRKSRGRQAATVWLSTRQFSTALLPETALTVVDIGVPGEWPFFWQRFSLRSLVRVVADVSRERSIPCLVGASVPTLSLLDACGVSLESMSRPSRQPKPISFMVRGQEPGLPTKSDPTGILLKPTMRMLRQVYDGGSSSLLLLNIRGLATLIECAECGYTATCPSCGATLTLRADRAALFCKQCGHSEHSPDVCPNCHGSQLRSRGYGLDRLVRELSRTFPPSSIVSVDSADDHTVFLRRTPSLYLGTYADVQLIALLTPSLVVFPDVSVGLRHPVFDNVEQLVAVVRGAVAETASGTVVVQLDRRSIQLRDDLDDAPMMSFLEGEQSQRRELMMPPFARQYVLRLSTRAASPDIEELKKSLVETLMTEDVIPHGLHADLLSLAPGSRVVSLEFRADAREVALEVRVAKALSHNKLFQNAGIRIY